MKILITSFFIFCLFSVQPALASLRPNDTFYKNQWYLAKIKADSAWEKITKSPDIVIAVIDSGIQIDHPDLKNNIWINRGEIENNGIDDDNNGFIDDFKGWNFVSNIPDPSPEFIDNWTEAGISHGTVVSGIIAAQGNNNIGVVGVTWQTQIMPLKVMNDRGEGRISDVIRAIDYATNNGADIINLSFVSFSYSDALQEAIYRANRSGVIIVAAAGNEQSAGVGYDIDETPIYPACYDGRLIGENMVIGVAATDALDQKTPFSSYGNHCIDMVAPGISFFSTVTTGSDKNDPGKNYDGYWSGTSMATPLISGTLALIEQANPALSRQEVMNILFASTDNVSRLNPNYLGKLGNGRVNVDRAVAMAKERLYSRVGRLLVIPGGEEPLRLTAVNGDLVKEIVLPSDLKKGHFISGDVTGDGQEEIIIGAGQGDQPTVNILNGEGKILKSFLVYPAEFRGGVKVALIDLDNDNRAEIIVAPASGVGSEIKIYDYNGRLKRSFWADSRNFRGGFSLSVGDIDGKGGQQIVLGFGPGNEPQVRIFNTEGKLIGVFLAYEKTFKGGVNVVVGNIDGRKDHSKSEIIVSPGVGRYPLIKVFDNHAISKRQFYAYTKNWQGGVNIAVDDLDNDGISEIVVGAYPGAAPHIRVFSGRGILIESFYALSESFADGVNIDIMKISN